MTSRTCLTWTPDGELAEEDHHDILARLAAIDPFGDWLCSCQLDTPEPSPTDGYKYTSSSGYPTRLELLRP